MKEKLSVKGFGLIIIGTEILDGRAVDRHFENTRRILRACHHPIRYTMILADDPALITAQLRWAMSMPEPFFSFGGIGSTPDDYTRQCAAEAAGVQLEFHEEGVRLLEKRFVSGGGTEIHLGIQGRPEDVEKGYRDLVERLEDMGLRWVEKDEQGVEQ